MYFLFLILICVSCYNYGNSKLETEIDTKLELKEDWLLNHPKKFEHPKFELIPIRGSLIEFNKLIDIELSYTYKNTDGESTDALEHYFYGLDNGISMELGAVDGSRKFGSQTIVFDSLNWGRILVEGNYAHRDSLLKLNETCGVSAAICKKAGIVHYVSHSFMSESFIKSFFHGRNSIYTTLYGEHHSKSVSNTNINSNIQPHIPNYSLLDGFPNVKKIPCIPLHAVLKRANVSHINFFILDVEGGELDVLHTINWNTTTFDVLVI